MTREDLIDEYKDIPEAIVSTLTMNNVNERIHFYEGRFLLQLDGKEMVLEGEITFDWVANLGAHFSGKVISGLGYYESFSITRNNHKMIVDGLPFGDGFITSVKEGKEDELFIKGTVSAHALLGDATIPVTKIRFSIPNLRGFYGTPSKTITKNNVSWSARRLMLEIDKYIIVIDKCKDHKERQESLQEKGGYIIQYHGELSVKKGYLKHADTEDIFHCLNTFLCFLNGRRTSAIFLQGMHEGSAIWSDYTAYLADPYKDVYTWPQKDTVRGLNELWQKFSLLWKNKEDKNFLSSAVHWYVEANGSKGFSEGAIIMAQTALELLYNWWIIERKKMIIGKDSENIAASNKIRLLLSQLNIPHTVPIAFKHLQEFLDTNSEAVDAPDAVVQIRNAIVHSQQEKRKKLDNIHYLAKYQALQLCVWYIEMSLLCILEYDDLYLNRCSNEVYLYMAKELVPWTKKKIEPEPKVLESSTT